MIIKAFEFKRREANGRRQISTIWWKYDENQRYEHVSGGDSSIFLILIQISKMVSAPCELEFDDLLFSNWRWYLHTTPDSHLPLSLSLRSHTPRSNQCLRFVSFIVIGSSFTTASIPLISATFDLILWNNNCLCVFSSRASNIFKLIGNPWTNQNVRNNNRTGLYSTSKTIFVWLSAVLFVILADTL